MPELGTRTMMDGTDHVSESTVYKWVIGVLAGLANVLIAVVWNGMQKDRSKLEAELEKKVSKDVWETTMRAQDERHERMERALARIEDKLDRKG